MSEKSSELEKQAQKTLDRFWAKIALQDNGCWEWTASKTNGYGQFRHDNRHGSAHRYSYKVHVGPIPEGLQIDHLCRNPGCVNPYHLEAVTQSENAKRGLTGRHSNKGVQHRRKTHCPKGHPYDALNTAGGRVCTICRNARKRIRYARKRLALGKAYSPRVAESQGK